VPAAVTPGASSVVSALTVATTDPDTPVGPFILTIEGTAGADLASTSVSLDVTAAPDLTPGTAPAVTTLTISTTVPGTPSGTHGVSIVATSGSTQRVDLITLAVSDYLVTVNPRTLTVPRGEEATYTVTVSPDADPGSFDEPVTLMCAGLPTDAACSFSEATVTPGSDEVEATLTVTSVGPSTPTGVATFTVVGASGALSRIADVDLELTTDFSIAVSPAAATVSAGSSVDFTIDVDESGYFDDEIAFSCSGLPAGATCAFSPNILLPTGNDATVMMSVSATASLTASFTGGLALPWWALWYTMLLAIPVALFGLLRKERSTRRRDRLRVRWVAGAAVVILSIIPTGCGDDPVAPQQQKPVTQDFTVTATGGTVTRSAQATITINP
jgi:hypothetical protein